MYNKYSTFQNNRQFREIIKTTKWQKVTSLKLVEKLMYLFLFCVGFVLFGEFNKTSQAWADGFWIFFCLFYSFFEMSVSLV